jgi:hypothetical protein
MPTSPEDLQILAESGVEPASAVAGEAVSGVVPEMASATPAASDPAAAQPASATPQPKAAAKPMPKKETKPDAKPDAKLDTRKAAEDKPDVRMSTESKAAGGAPHGQASQTGSQDKSDAGQADKKTLLELIKGGIEPGTEAYLVLRCPEGTQLFVDGQDKGKVGSSALKVPVSSGKHKLIVTSKKGELHTQDIELSSGKTVQVRPDFCN